MTPVRIFLPTMADQLAAPAFGLGLLFLNAKGNEREAG